MKIIWAIPDFAEPKTGGEKFYVKLKQSLAKRESFLNVERLEFFSSETIGRLIKSNFNNLNTLLHLDGDAFIFEEYTHRKYFLLADVILSLFFRRRYILFVHESFELSALSLMGGVLIRIVNFVIFGLANKIVVNSRSTAEWINRFGNFKKKMFVFYPVLKDDNEKEKPIERHNRCVKNLLCVANIRTNKGQECLITAMHMFKNRDVKLMLVGLVKEGAYYNSLCREIKSSGLDNNIVFTGFLDGNELAEVYKKADIFVLPTLKEGFGMVLLEAMSFGLPIIASNVGGIPEIIQDGVDGLLVPPASAHDLATAVNKLIEDENLRKRLSKNALDKYRSMPSWGRLFEDFYRFIS